ncbi:diacylglycerol kinase [bacterium (candidate division B38) B3_B38]|nr:MAG: diacylglycerol kinase [bacterium (candidate division B38) B3_B38]
MRAKFVLNPVAGMRRAPEKVVSLLRRELRGPLWDFDIILTEQRGHGYYLAQDAVKQGYELVVAIGGDGTVKEVASGLVHTGVALGIIPTGSGNGLARDLRIPLNLKGACRALLRGSRREVDTGVINGKYFFSTAGLGFDAHIGLLYNQRGKRRRRGVLPYFYIGVKEYFLYQPELLQVRIDRDNIRVSPLLITIANCRQYGGGAQIAPRAKIDDGLLDLCILRNLSLLQALIKLPKLFTGKIDSIPQMDYYQIAQTEIIREKPGPIHMDGDPFIEAPQLKVSILPRSLVVWAPSE